MMHPMLRVEPWTQAFGRARPETPGLRLVLLNALRTCRRTIAEVLAAGKFTLRLRCSKVLVSRHTAGAGARQPSLVSSHAPLFYFEAATLKLRSRCSRRAASGHLRGNAKRLLGWSCRISVISGPTLVAQTTANTVDRPQTSMVSLARSKDERAGHTSSARDILRIGLESGGGKRGCVRKRHALSRPPRGVFEIRVRLVVNTERNCPSHRPLASGEQQRAKYCGR